MPTGSYKLVEFHSLDLSAWTKFTVGLFAGYMLSADLGGLILCPAQSDANRATVRRELGRKVGLSL